MLGLGTLLGAAGGGGGGGGSSSSATSGNSPVTISNTVSSGGGLNIFEIAFGVIGIILVGLFLTLHKG